MKWIGQHIVDLIARFRSDVYLEDISTGTIASGGNLGLDSNNKIVKATEATGDITSIVAGTGLSGTSLTGPIPTLNVDASQTQITGVGTIATGVWNGDAIASAYLDADTMHYSAQRQLTHHYISDDIGTGVIYISLGEIDAENATISNKNLPLLAPVAGKLLKVFVRTSIDMSGVGLTWGLLTRSLGSSTSGAASVIGTKSVTGPTTMEMATCDFTSSVTGTNVIAAGDKVLLSIQGDASSGDCQFFITCLWEWNLS